MRKKNILGGIALILIAIYIVGSGLGLIMIIPWFKIICTILFGLGMIKGLKEREFFGFSFCAFALAWMYEDYLGIAEITPFPLFFSAIFLAIGLSMIFKKKAKFTSFDTVGEHTQQTYSDSHIHTGNYQDGRQVNLENSFNVVSKYVSSDAFSTAKLENNFGSANIYFNNAVIANGNATVVVKNNFGLMNIYFPGTWRVKVNREVAFGNINVYGSPNSDMDAPVVNIDAESSFGTINLYFE